MYQFFMGNRCNIHTKQLNEPTVIEVEKTTSKEINRWLDKYEIDFDVFIKAIIFIAKKEIEKIELEDTHIFKIVFVGKEEATIEFLISEYPKCKLCIRRNEYVFYLKEGLQMESCLQVKNNIKFGANAVENKIELGNKNTYLCLCLDKFNEQLYFSVQKHINELESWDNIAAVMCWIKSLPVVLPSYDLSIISIDEGYLGTVKISVIHDRIFRYVHINQTGNFQVDYDGAWEAKYHGFYFKYNLYEKICQIFLQKGMQFALPECINSFTYCVDLIKIMLGTLNIINSSFDEMEQIIEKGG